MVEVIGLRVRILCVQTESDEALNHPLRFALVLHHACSGALRVPMEP